MNTNRDATINRLQTSPLHVMQAYTFMVDVMKKCNTEGLLGA